MVLKVISPFLVAVFLIACGDNNPSSVTLSDKKEADPAATSSVSKLSSGKNTKSSSSSVKSKNSAVLSSSSMLSVKPCKTESEDSCEYGSLTDERDGQRYKTVKIGNQGWMAENLNYQTENSYCYNDSISNCAKFGRFYTWSAVMDSAGIWSKDGYGCGYSKYKTCYKTISPTDLVRGVCPSGWHVPSKTEFETLMTSVGGSQNAGLMLKSASGWRDNANNSLGNFSFSALPAGIRSDNGMSFRKGSDAYFWSSSEDSFLQAIGMDLYCYNNESELLPYYKNMGFSIRCVKD